MKRLFIQAGVLVYTLTGAGMAWSADLRMATNQPPISPPPAIHISSPPPVTYAPSPPPVSHISAPPPEIHVSTPPPASPAFSPQPAQSGGRQQQFSVGAEVVHSSSVGDSPSEIHRRAYDLHRSEEAVRNAAEAAKEAQNRASDRQHMHGHSIVPAGGEADHRHTAKENCDERVAGQSHKICNPLFGPCPGCAYHPSPAYFTGNCYHSGYGYGGSSSVGDYISYQACAACLYPPVFLADTGEICGLDPIQQLMGMPNDLICSEFGEGDNGGGVTAIVLKADVAPLMSGFPWVALLAIGCVLLAVCNGILLRLLLRNHARSSCRGEFALPGDHQ